MAEGPGGSDEGDAREAWRADPAHPARHPDRLPQGLGPGGRRGVGEESVLQKGARVAEVLRLARRAGEAIPLSAVLLRCELLLARGETGREGGEEAIEVTGQVRGCRREPRASSSRPTLT